MAGSRPQSRNASESRRTTMGGGEADTVLGAVGAALDTRQLEAFGRKVTATASHLMGDAEGTESYRGAMTSVTRAMRRPGMQRGVFSLTNAAPTEFVRSKMSTSEIAHRALTYIPDEQLANIPDSETTYSLFQGFQATIPETENGHRKGHRRRASKQKLLGAPGGDIEEDGPPTLANLKKKRNQTNHRLEMMGIRKNMCGSEIHEIDNKIINLNNMRRIVLDRLAGLEDEEVAMEQSLQALDNQIEEMQEELEEQEAMKQTPALEDDRPTTPEAEAMDASFMSESIYAKIPSPKSSKKKRPNFKTRKSLPILHEHLESGSNLKTLSAHTDTITALDFDIPFGTLVTASLDDTVKVWDLNLGRCMGFLEGHTASVRCLQVEDNLVVTGSLDATVRLWDLSKASYEPAEHRDPTDETSSDDGMAFGNADEDAPPPPPPDAMADTPLYTLEAHLDAITALHLRGDTLVTGSADKTLRQWDLVKGRCVQTLDVLWAAAQASSTFGAADSTFRPTARGGADISTTGGVPFVGALQVFDAALACGTADGMVRLWDLRSGQVHRSLVGHTGGVTALMFDDVRIVTGSVDRSVRIWDLRTGTIFDAYAYDNPITSMMFDARHIVSAAGEDVVKVYDRTDGRHWDCGRGVDGEDEEDEFGGKKQRNTSVVEKVRIKDGYMVEGRRDGGVGVWTC